MPGSRAIVHLITPPRSWLATRRQPARRQRLNNPVSQAARVISRWVAMPFKTARHVSGGA